MSKYSSFQLIEPSVVQIGLKVHSHGAVAATAFYRPQRSWGKVIFSQASVILSTGEGGYLGKQVPSPKTRYTPTGTRYTPPGTRYTPPWDQEHPKDQVPPGPGTPWTRYTPQDQVQPPALGPGTPPRTRYTPPWDQVHP